MRLALAALAAALLPVGAAQAADWPGFDYDTARSGSGPVATGITEANAGHLVRRKVQLDGTVDTAPIYIHGVTVGGSVHDVFFLTTTYGRTEAIDAATGSVLWRYVPATYASYAGSPQITTMTPQAD
ncbi:MAG: hypothetical protein JO017_11455, partial [Actinobacteria bacterium]|nr:hypothetical protein [Actinomycetota bacterium]